MADFTTNQQSQNANPPITQSSVLHEPYTNQNPVPTNLPSATPGFDQPNPVRSIPSSNSSGGEPTKVPNLQSNMFKMQRNRSNNCLHELFFFYFIFHFNASLPFLALKKSYVDVFNPSGAPTKPIEPIMAPSVPVPSIPQSGYFVPGAVPAVGDNQTQQLDVSILLEIRNFLIFLLSSWMNLWEKNPKTFLQDFKELTYRILKNFIYPSAIYFQELKCYVVLTRNRNQIFRNWSVE